MRTRRPCFSRDSQNHSPKVRQRERFWPHGVQSPRVRLRSRARMRPTSRDARMLSERWPCQCLGAPSCVGSPHVTPTVAQALLFTQSTWNWYEFF